MQPTSCLLRDVQMKLPAASKHPNKDTPAATVAALGGTYTKTTMVSLDLHSTPRWTIRVLLFVALSLFGQAALAADGGSRCSRLQDESIRLYETGNSRQALPMLQEAHRCRPSTRLLLYIGLSQRELGRLDEALVSLKRARDQAGDDTQIADLAERGMKEAEQQKQNVQTPNRSPQAEPERPQVWAGDLERSRRQQRLVGWVLLGAGLLGVAAGATMLGIDGMPACSKEPRDIRCPEVLNTWPSGVALLTVGGSALIASSVLLIRSRPRNEVPVALQLIGGNPVFGIATRF